MCAESEAVPRFLSERCGAFTSPSTRSQNCAGVVVIELRAREVSYAGLSPGEQTNAQRVSRCQTPRCLTARWISSSFSLPAYRAA
jgi:hypothetical protein